jgi:hypothetical protein
MHTGTSATGALEQKKKKEEEEEEDNAQGIWFRWKVHNSAGAYWYGEL